MRVSGKTISLGRFSTEIEAYNAYQAGIVTGTKRSANPELVWDKIKF